MRKIIIAAFVSLDGIMQAPGGPDEDPTGGFAFGGWIVPWFDDVTGTNIGERFDKPTDLLLGRKTYDIFAAYWPYVQKDPTAADYEPGMAQIGTLFDAATKYVATHRPDGLTWANSQGLGDDVVASLRAIKAGEGPDLLVQGSTEVIRILLENDLADEIHLMIYPVILGKGKRLFSGNALPGGFKLTKSLISPTGVLIADYTRDGEVKTGSFGMETPTDAELERRRTLS